MLRSAQTRLTSTVCAAAAACLLTTPTADALGSASGPTACSSGVAAVSYQGRTWCPGDVPSVKQTAYGTGTRIVLPAVYVTSRSGLTVKVSGGRMCSGESCSGATQTLTVRFSTSPVPSPGSFVDLYGVTTSGGLTPKGFVNRGVISCPDC